MPPDDIYDLQIARRRAVHLDRPAVDADGHATAGMVDLNRAGWARGAQRLAAGDAPPARLRHDAGRAVHAQREPRLRRAHVARSIDERREAYADPAWRDEAAHRWDDRHRPDAPLGHLRDRREPGPPRARWAAASTRSPPSAAAGPFDVLLDIALDEPDLMLRVRCILANDDVDEVGRLLHEDHCTLGLSDAGAHVGPAVRRPAGHRPARQLGARARHHEHRGRGPQAHPGPGRPVRPRRPGRAPRPGRGPTSSCSIPPPSPPGPIRRVADFPAGSERLTADAPSGVRHVLVNGVPDPRRREAGRGRWPRSARRSRSRLTRPVRLPLFPASLPVGEDQ